MKKEHFFLQETQFNENEEKNSTKLNENTNIFQFILNNMSFYIRQNNCKFKIHVQIKMK